MIGFIGEQLVLRRFAVCPNCLEDQAERKFNISEPVCCSGNCMYVFFVRLS